MKFPNVANTCIGHCGKSCHLGELREIQQLGERIPGAR